jgi:hypothetical protein
MCTIYIYKINSTEDIMNKYMFFLKEKRNPTMSFIGEKDCQNTSHLSFKGQNNCSKGLQLLSTEVLLCVKSNKQAKIVYNSYK